MKNSFCIIALLISIISNVMAQSPLDSLLQVEDVKILERNLQIAKSQKNFDRCLIILDSLITLNPTCASYYFSKGYYYERKDNLRDYEIYLIKAMQLGYDSLLVYKKFYNTYNSRNNYEKALYYAQEMVRMKPENPDLYLNIAGVYASMGDWEKYDEYFLIAANKGSKRANIIIEERKKEGTWQK